LTNVAGNGNDELVNAKCKMQNEKWQKEYGRRPQQGCFSFATLHFSFCILHLPFGVSWVAFFFNLTGC
jgi:hypothetical protein